MAEKILIRLIVNGEEKQKLEARLDLKSPANSNINTSILRVPIISGENHINPESIRDVETAYRTFEAIRKDEYNKRGQKTTIELTYE